jgi:NADPH-dependent 2,4-dienoyl-CoA reductase/sulfur reductase-like enzyme
MSGVEQPGIVVIGGGHAGAQLCNALAAAGLGPRVHLVCAERVLPYQRPPLSKAFLKNPDEALQLHRPAEWFAESGITVHLGDAAAAIDRAARRVTLASGRVLAYERPPARGRAACRSCRRGWTTWPNSGRPQTQSGCARGWEPWRR